MPARCIQHMPCQSTYPLFFNDLQPQQRRIRRALATPVLRYAVKARNAAGLRCRQDATSAASLRNRPGLSP